MTKRELIDEIMELNHSADPGFLARFDDIELNNYLDHLSLLQAPRLEGDPHRYDKYFQAEPADSPCAVAVAELPCQSDAAIAADLATWRDETPAVPATPRSLSEEWQMRVDRFADHLKTQPDEVHTPELVQTSVKESATCVSSRLDEGRDEREGWLF
ncbi:MAG: hypothetical protein K8S55_01025 [Phycisphaerae bacterium]|nr:hypothetical protein [Phycisphaerae bacterium]